MFDRRLKASAAIAEKHFNRCVYPVRLWSECNQIQVSVGIQISQVELDSVDSELGLREEGQVRIK